MIINSIQKTIIYLMAISLWTLLIILFLYTPYFFKSVWNPSQVNVLAFPQIIDKEYVTHFEQQTGIHVNITYFESSEELLTKLETTPEHGYDLLMISDFFVPTLIEKGFIKKLDKTKLTFLHSVYPALLNHSFDPGNQYTIPCFWSVYGIGLDLNYFNGTMPPINWSLLFERYFAHEQVGMIEDIREIVTIAAYYLFNTTENLTPEQIDKVTQLLIEQKKWVAVYTDMRSEYLLIAKTCPLVLSSNSDIAKVAKAYPNVRFAVPEQGSFVKIDSYVVAAHTKNENAVYALLNYIHEPEVMKQYVDKFQFFPVVSTVQFDQVLPGYSVPSADIFARMHFFKPLISSDVVQKIWIAVKAA